MSLLFSTGAIAGSAAKGAPGMVLLTPSSITHSGTSASIGANGQVTFSAVTSLSLNGVFSADFDNYVVSVRVTSSLSTNENVLFSSTGRTFTRQELDVYGTTISATRETSQSSVKICTVNSGSYSGSQILLYGPFLSQSTALRTVDASNYLGASMRQHAATSDSASMTSFTLTPSGGNITGALQVYGVQS